MASEAERRAAAAAKKVAARQAAQDEINRLDSLRLLAAIAPDVRAAERRLQEIRDRQTAQLVRGRQAGLSWGQLAAASGVTRQAVQQRVSAVLDAAG